MKFKIVMFCMFFSAIIISCKKEVIGTSNNPGTPANSYVAVLSKVLTDNKSTYEYVYNDSSLVTQEKSKFDYVIHNYNSKGQLITTEYYSNDDVLRSNLQVAQSAITSTVWVTPDNGKKGGIITYEYNNNSQLVKSSYTRPSATCSDYSVFAYSNNRISRQTMYWENTATGYIDYSYDSSGNLIKETLYNTPSSGVAEIITSTQYTFDNQFNPYRNTSRLLIPGINTNLNNIVKEVSTIHVPAGQGADNVQTIETSYQYNGMGYPVSKNGNITYVYK